ETRSDPKARRPQSPDPKAREAKQPAVAQKVISSPTPISVPQAVKEIERAASGKPVPIRRSRGASPSHPRSPRRSRPGRGMGYRSTFASSMSIAGTEAKAERAAGERAYRTWHTGLLLSSACSAGRSVEHGYPMRGDSDDTMPEMRLVPT